MNAETVVLESQETFLSPVQPLEPLETTWKINTELSNIISLAEQGLLHTPNPEDKFDEEFLAYDNYSPLNEW
jgi:hypothetical protein